MKVLRKESPAYSKYLNHFKKQFGDVVELVRLFINDSNQVYAAEWIDSKGVINFNSGYAIDLKVTVIVK